MNIKTEYFDQKIINCNFVPGYIITIENCNIDKKVIIDFLSNNFDEGIVNNNCKDHLMIDSESWHLFITKRRYRIILKTLNQVKKFFNYFDINEQIDYKTLSIEYKLKEKLQKYIFELNTQKIRNKIREDVRKILGVKPYDFNLIINEKGIKIFSDKINILVNA
jgi:ribosomal protein L23